MLSLHVSESHSRNEEVLENALLLELHGKFDRTDIVVHLLRMRSRVPKIPRRWFHMHDAVHEVLLLCVLAVRSIRFVHGPF